MRTSSAVLLASILLAAACGTSGDADPTPGDGGTTATTAPDGNGVCCTPNVAPACCMAFGGWAPKAELCGEMTSCDGMPVPDDPAWKLGKDEHGCDVWAASPPRGTKGVCGAFTPPKDGGPDAANNKSCPATRSEALAQCASQSSCFPEGVKCSYPPDADGGADAGADAGGDAGTLVVECATKWTCSGGG